MSPHERFHALDALRAFALLLGIALHASMSFFLVIPAKDVSQSTALAVLFYVIHTFRMSVFFLIAGFFARLALHRRGTRAFVKDRARRIVAPMVGGWIVLAPVTIAIVIWGLSRTYAGGAPPAPANAPATGLPLTHLWFLYYLSIFYVAALCIRAGINRPDARGALRSLSDSVLRRALTARLLPIALAAPIFCVLYLDANWAVWFGIRTPDTGLTPQLPALVAYGTAFLTGWSLHRQSGLLDIVARQWRGNLVVAAALTATALAIAGVQPDLSSPTALAGGQAMRAVYAACYALSVWYWSLALTGAAVRHFNRAQRVTRQLADASYWIYLAHLPIVFALQVLAMNVPVHWSVKFPVIVAITLGVLLGSWHFFLRRSALGELLGSRNTATDAAPPTTSLTGVSADDANTRESGTIAAGLRNVTKRYGATTALDGVSLTARCGELLALLGPNGAGKSTAISLWLGLLQPGEGAVTLLGGSPLDVHSRLGAGVMMQDVALPPALNAREHLALASSCYREPLTVEEAIAATGIEAIAGTPYGRLSAGQKRQVQFALAICGRPAVLFLDEPTVGLDVDARHAMWRNIRRLVSEGCAIVLTTHYLEEAEALADRVAVIAKGSVIAEGTVEEIRGAVTRTRIRCLSALATEDVRLWPGVLDAVREEQFLQVTAAEGEMVVRLLLEADPGLRRLEVSQASLADAFTKLTKEAA